MNSDAIYTVTVNPRRLHDSQKSAEFPKQCYLFIPNILPPTYHTTRVAAVISRYQITRIDIDSIVVINNNPNNPILGSGVASPAAASDMDSTVNYHRSFLVLTPEPNSVAYGFSRYAANCGKTHLVGRNGYRLTVRLLRRWRAVPITGK